VSESVGRRNCAACQLYTAAASAAAELLLS
jgi:hypothetical protein